MELNLDDLHGLLLARQNRLLVGYAPFEAKAYFKAKTNKIYLSDQTISKNILKHKIPIEELLKIPKALSAGLWVADRPNACCISYFCSIDNLRYILAAKVTANKAEIFLTTMHRGGQRQTAAIIKRGPILRTHA